MVASGVLGVIVIGLPSTSPDNSETYRRTLPSKSSDDAVVVIMVPPSLTASWVPLITIDVAENSIISTLPEAVGTLTTPWYAKPVRLADEAVRVAWEVETAKGGREPVGVELGVGLRVGLALELALPLEPAVALGSGEELVPGLAGLGVLELAAAGGLGAGEAAELGLADPGALGLAEADVLGLAEAEALGSVVVAVTGVRCTTPASTASAGSKTNSRWMGPCSSPVPGEAL